MKKYSLAVLITLMAFTASIAAPVNPTTATGTESTYQVKKKGTHKHHKKHHKKHAAKKSAAANK